MLCSLILAGSLAAPLASDPTPSTRYYMILFGGQSVPFVPRTAHTWATFVKVTSSREEIRVEPHTISWLPADGDVHLRNLLPAKGKNCTLSQTFEIMAGHNAQISYWGPFEIDAVRYEKALGQIHWLNSGEISYRVIDSFRCKPTVCHCVHAITYTEPLLDWMRQPVLRVGEPGTSELALWYVRSGAFRGGDATHDWLIPVLEIDKAGAIKRRPGQWIPREWR